MVEVRRATFFYPKYLLFGISAVILKLGIYFLQVQNMTESPDTVTIKNGNSSATVHLFGATLTSWISQGKGILFVSKKSLFDNKKAIRGGVPVVFPQFGPWANGPQHGFARISRWSLKDEHKTDDMSVTLVLEDTEATRSYWDFKFRFEYTLSLISETQLKMDVVITNTDVTLCKVTGLKDCTYIDKVRNGKEFIEDREEVTVSEFTDRIYKNTSVVHKIKNLSGDREGSIEKFNLPDTVIWNPWIENAKSMTDFDDDEWKNMICVEAGYVSSSVALQSSKSFLASQILSVH